MDSLREAIHELELEKIINIDMDGNAVNHRVFRLINMITKSGLTRISKCNRLWFHFVIGEYGLVYLLKI